ncbi:unnamed protein product [Kuraishia capsulata CBS 1993]|uniref:Phenylalanine--tRNA ligase, mitochondrial n=1 Tax=Kuraishia capsulata CBS 1993 TaxID=1382522 RepID=W6MSU2_9ASCO|nr:uncharacterized protein KUCA_T00000807001 [Kuraishia capsulata CBS 1993]CDK24840.1 unnamed protein product [Kuraishia capsulata CBS 1993]
MGNYTFFNDFEPFVTKYENFDALGFPEDHPGRSKSDTYYLNSDSLLRTHTSAHEVECFQTSKTAGYLISADVYRRDEIDKTHYPVFHQMEGARIWKKSDFSSQEELINQLEKDIESLPKTNMIVEDPNPPFHEERNPKQDHMTDRETDLVAQHLKRTIEILVSQVFQTDEPLRVRWVEAYFPWTAPSWEIEVWWENEWLECCGCGVVRKPVLDTSGLDDTIGWAFGVGLDRLAMLLFGIPDIRLFWTLDPRFKSQFMEGQISKFKPYSKYPGTMRDVSYWINEDRSIHENDLMEIVRNTAGDLVESVKLIDEFVQPKTGRKSQCYRIHYQSMERSLTNEEINRYNDEVRDTLVKDFGLELR